MACLPNCAEPGQTPINSQEERDQDDDGDGDAEDEKQQ
jgi:hypothetical protein